MECSPTDLAMLDRYQATVAMQVQLDDDGENVLGFPLEAYLHLGLREELDETWGPDRLNPSYRRLGALVTAETSTHLLMSGEATDLALELHRKEFGDVSWYLANLLSYYGVSISEAVAKGIEAYEIEINSQPRCGPDFCIEVERIFPFFNYAGYMSQLEEAAFEVMRSTTAATIDAFSQTAGKFILVMSHIVQARLGDTYEAVLQGNIDKVNRRIREGTVFDKTLGDIR